jgi:hypothetical protein
MTQKTMRPADGKSAGPRKASQLGSCPSNTPVASTYQAPCPADGRGEDDASFFARRPGLTRRLRFAFIGEFPIDMTDDLGVALVSVRMDRNALGQRCKRMRAIFFREGGSA